MNFLSTNKNKIIFAFLIISIDLLSACNNLLAQESNSNFKKDKVVLAINSIDRKLQSKLNLNVNFENIQNSIRYDNIYYVKKENKDNIFLLKYLYLLQKELSKYPESFLNDISINEVLIVKNLFYYSKAAEGAYNPKNKILILDFLRSKDNPIVQTHNIHHEIYHVFTANYDYYLNINKWSAFNEATFKYSQDYNKFYKINSRFKPQQINKGFISLYSMSSPLEDMAEIYAALMIKSQAKLLNDWAKDDEILKKKIDFIKDFSLKISSKLNDSFWENITTNH